MDGKNSHPVGRMWRQDRRTYVTCVHAAPAVATKCPEDNDNSNTMFLAHVARLRSAQSNTDVTDVHMDQGVAVKGYSAKEIRKCLAEGANSGPLCLLDIWTTSQEQCGDI